MNIIRQFMTWNCHSIGFIVNELILFRPKYFVMCQYLTRIIFFYSNFKFFDKKSTIWILEAFYCHLLKKDKRKWNFDSKPKWSFVEKFSFPILWCGTIENIGKREEIELINIYTNIMLIYNINRETWWYYNLLVSTCIYLP